MITYTPYFPIHVPLLQIRAKKQQWRLQSSVNLYDGESGLGLKPCNNPLSFKKFSSNSTQILDQNELFGIWLKRVIIGSLIQCGFDYSVNLLDLISIVSWYISQRTDSQIVAHHNLFIVSNCFYKYQMFLLHVLSFQLYVYFAIYLMLSLIHI